MGMPWRRQKGLSLIEMMIALAVAGITIAGVYKIFASQQKSFVVQEEVSDAQQSARAVMDIISRDIRMAGFGMPGWAVGGLTNQIRIDQSSPADFTVVGVFSEPIAKLANPASMGQTQVVLDTMGQQVEMTKGDNLFIFESDRPVPPILSAGEVLAPPLRYGTVVVWTSISGSDPVVDIDADGETGAARDGLSANLRANALVYRVGTVTYQLVGNTLTRNGSILAANVADLQIIDQFNPGPPPVPETYGSYQIVLTVNTRTNDPDFPGATRARTLTSTIKARNLVFHG
jgi:prepilin-type N-terminal cleavage/methylation domain-containing protein